MPSPGAGWLLPDDVAAWLKLASGVDPVLIQCCARCEVEVQRARPDQWVTVLLADTVTIAYRPDAEVYNAAVMLAARLYRRRNSPGGIEAFGDSVTYVARYDPEIQRALRLGAWTAPAVG
jgi:hypothetical protein